MRLLAVLLLWCLSLPAAEEPLFEKKNLAAWCIVPFDARKRGPEERAAMLERLGFTKFVYDYRGEHIPQWDEELAALKRHHVALLGWWFPGSLNSEATRALDLFQRHGVHPQLWVTGNGGSITVKDEADRQARIAKEVARLAPIAEAAAKVGCQVGLYNHGSWFGEPENALAIVEALKAAGHGNVGLVYNLHHGHGHLARLEQVLPRMLPHLLCLNLNGMDVDGEAKGRKILPLGAGSQDLRVLKQVRASGYAGPIGILNHTDEDAEGRLLDNLDGLRWLVAQLDDVPPGPRPAYRTWRDSPEAASTAVHGEPSLAPEFGRALRGGLVVEGAPDFHRWPLTVECRARLDSKKKFNILVANHEKAAVTHWEVYTHAGTGQLSVYLPGRGGDFRSPVDICDGQWHDILVSLEDAAVRIWVDGKQVLEKAPTPVVAGRAASAEKLAFGRLVEGTLGCDGLIDDVRISRGVNVPMSWMKGPRKRLDITLGLWDFDDLGRAAAVSSAPAVALFNPAREPLRPEDNLHAAHPVNRDRVFDFYAKEAMAFMNAKPRPSLLAAYPGLDGGNQGHWGNQNDAVTWKDGRWDKADHGTLFSGVFRGAGLTVVKGVCVRKGDQAACFDPLTLTFPVRWKGGFIQLSDHRHGFNSSANMAGQLVRKETPAKSPVRGVYHGFYRHGDETVFAYARDGREYLATAWEGEGEPAKFATLTKGGPAQWPQWLETKGTLGRQQPFATDSIGVPFQNPYGTIFFITGLDFFPDGSAAVCTMTGEVWLVRGIDEGLEKVRWKRYATGLHQALGLRVLDGKVCVLGRDQITRLHDLNGDDEADFYECVMNAYATSPGGHDFIVGLDTDKQGRFYTASGNQGLLRLMPPDKVEVLATGLRNPNGVAVTADGRFVTSSVQEGDWTPASAVCQVDVERNLGAHFGAGGPKKGDLLLPLLQLPRGEDNSSGGQVFLSESGWPSLRGDGNLVHFSFGTGSAWLVTRQLVDGLWQAAAVKISGNFSSGPQHGRFGPKDGHLYVSGMVGWGSYTFDDGCLQRLRYTGGETPVLVGHEVRDNGVLLRFSRPLGTDAADATRHFAQAWDYHYSGAYGSPEYSVRHPEVAGHDVLDIRSAQVLDGGTTLFLEIPQLQPSSQVHLHVGATSDRPIDVFVTANKLGAPFTSFPGYVAVPKEKAHAHLAMAAGAVNPVKWEIEMCGGPVREIRLQTASGLQYAQKELRAKAGEGIALIFENPDVMPHNWVLVMPGAEDRVGDLASKMVAAADGFARHYVPDSPEVLCHSRLLDPQKKVTVYFNAPKTPGRYPYLCTFPGHSQIMRGVLIVE